jgi:hypothetical protein
VHFIFTVFLFFLIVPVWQHYFLFRKSGVLIPQFTLFLAATSKRRRRRQTGE